MDDFIRPKKLNPSREVRSAPPLPSNVTVPVQKLPQPTRINVRLASEPKPMPRPMVSAMPAAEPVFAERPPGPESGPDMTLDPAPPKKTTANPLLRALKGYWRKKWLTLPLTVLLLAGVVAGLPQTRYPLLALFMTRAYAVTVEDSKTNTPVSGAQVVLDGATQTTDGSGHARFIVKVGPGSLTVTKKYYQAAHTKVFVDLSPQHNSSNIALVATGRQVPIKVIDKISGKALPNVSVRAGDTDATTGTDGLVTMVLPTTASTQPVTFSADGYATLNGKVQVTSDAVAANTFALVPMGRVYFLSNLSGKIDVVSTQLDGSDRQTVLAGTGTEDTNNTVLLASRDWQYLALLSKRDGGSQPKLFLIATASGKLTTIDQGSDFTPIGWDDHYFVYKAANSGLSSWQPGATLIKSYNTDSSKAVTIATSNATGTSNADAQYQNIWDTVFIGRNLVYDVTWYRYPGNLDVTGQQDTLMSVKPDGTGSKTLKSVDAGQFYFSGLRLASPSFAYLGVYSAGGSGANYYKLDTNGNLSQSNTITSDTLSKDYPTYLESPSGKATFWTELRDGKNTLFTGDAPGNNASQVANLSEYAPYGWYTDNYLLVQKAGSELYIMPTAGGTPVKISDYYKPAASFAGYGGI